MLKYGLSQTISNCIGLYRTINDYIIFDIIPVVFFGTFSYDEEETTNMDDQELMTIREAAKFLKMHYQTVREKVANGEIPSFKLGRIYRILKSDVMKYLAEQNENSHK